MNVQDFKDKHRGETCYILGNGPSLNEVDLKGLKHPTFGSNRIYLSGWEPTYYSCCNPLVLAQWGEEIEKLECVKFLNEPYASQMGGVRIDTSLGEPMFANPEGPIWEGHTVTYVLLQLAYYMGFGRAILLGVDHDYGDKGRQPNLEMVATGPDPYHFSSEYFSQGARWNAPDLGRSELAYSLANAACTLRRITQYMGIINASAHTKLTVFPLISLKRLDHMDEHPATPRVSAIVSAYKCGKDWLAGCIEDILLQSERPEIVVVCQLDSQEYKLLLEKYGSFDSTVIEVVVTPDVPTVYRAWNLGIRAAHGKYITNWNTDDRRHPLSLETLANVLDARPEIDVAYHDQYVTWDQPQSFEQFMKELDKSGGKLAAGRVEGKPGYFIWLEHSLKALGQGCYVGPQPMWRASLHQRHGWFLENYKSAGDYEFWLRVAKDDNFMHVGAFLGVYCARMDGIELGNPTQSVEEAFLAQTIHQDPDDASYEAVGDGMIRIEIGGRYVYGGLGQLVNVVEQLKKRYEEVKA